MFYGVETIFIYPDRELDKTLHLLYTIVVNRYKTQMTVTTNDRGQQTPNEWKETYNGRWAMLGIIAGALSYSLTGKLFFGIF